MEMKNLKDVLEKLKVDDIVLPEKFPMDGTMEDMIKFLEGQGFQRIGKGYVKTVFNEAKAKCFMRDNTFIIFADTSKREVSKDNPIFYIFFDYRAQYSVYYCHLSNHSGTYIVKNDKKKFLEELNKRFGWK